MHPVQAAPRQRGAASRRLYTTSTMHPVQAAPRQSPQGEALQGKEPGCTPCRQRRGKGRGERNAQLSAADAPRAGSAEAKWPYTTVGAAAAGCTPCRQRRGKVDHHILAGVHVLDAPRAGSAEAKSSVTLPVDDILPDAPRAGSAEAKCCKRAGAVVSS